MSKKAEATYHGADIVTRLRAQAPYSDDGQAMTEAAQEIEHLRGELKEAESRAFPKEGFVIQIPAEAKRYLR